MNNNKHNTNVDPLLLDIHPYNPMDDAVEIIEAGPDAPEGDEPSGKQEDIDMYYYRLRLIRLEEIANVGRKAGFGSLFF